MDAIEQSSAIDLQEQADQDTVMRNLLDGLPVDAEVLRRVQERSRRITAEIRRDRGDVDVEKLLGDAG